MDIYFPFFVDNVDDSDACVFMDKYLPFLFDTVHDSEACVIRFDLCCVLILFIILFSSDCATGVPFSATMDGCLPLLLIDEVHQSRACVCVLFSNSILTHNDEWIFSLSS